MPQPSPQGAQLLRAGLCLALAAASSVARAECAATSTDLADAVRRADDSYVAMDLDGFHDALDDARGAVSCLVVVVTTSDAAGYHRLEALDAFVAQDDARTVDGFRAVLALQPRHQLPPSIAPKGNPLFERFVEAARMPPSATEPVELTRGDMLYVDGVMLTARPTERPSIVQITTDEGAVRYSAYVLPGEPLPSFQRTSRTRRPGRTWALGAGLSGAAAAGLYAGAVQTRLSFDDPTTPTSDLPGLAERTNTLAWGAVGAAGLGVGLATVAVVRTNW